MSSSWWDWSRSRRLSRCSISGKLRVVSLAILEALADASGVVRSLLASSDEGDALSGDGLPPTRKAVERDENIIDYALPGRPRPPLQLCFW
jgi:hypothetical protein